MIVVSGFLRTYINKEAVNSVQIGFIKAKQFKIILRLKQDKCIINTTKEKSGVKGISFDIQYADPMLCDRIYCRGLY